MSSLIVFKMTNSKIKSNHQQNTNGNEFDKPNIDTVSLFRNIFILLSISVR